MKLFGEMLCDTLDIIPEKGDLNGDCCICKKHTKTGFKKKFGANFTSSEFVSSGDVICPYCNHLVKNSNEYRRTMFLLTENNFIKFKKKEAKNIVLNLPDGPFYIYLTKTWQKIGWIRMNDAYNHNNKSLVKIVMDYDIINTDLNTVKDYCDFISNLRALKVPKNSLETGEFENHIYKNIVDEYGRVKARYILKYVKNNVHNPVWDLAVYLED